MKTNKRFLLAAGILLALIFTFSCSSGGGDDTGGNSGGSGVSFNENSQIYNGYWDNDDVWHIGEAYTGDGVIKIRLYGEDGKSETLIDAGSVKNGIVKLELPKTIPDNLLLPKGSAGNGCTVSSNDIKASDGGGFVLTDNNGKHIGDLSMGFSNEQISEEISYIYFSKAGKITCTGKKTINLNFKAGWNKMYCYQTKSVHEHNTNNILTKEVKWILEEEY